MSGSDSRAPFSLRRWSRRKLAAARAAGDTAVPPPAPAPPDAADRPPSQPVRVPEGAVADASGAVAPTAGEAPGQAGEGGAGRAVAEALPPVESLGFDSDFTPFLRPDVDETLKRAALKRLFRDARFNVIDGLDVYIDDYTKAEPIAPEMARRLAQARYVLDPPQTRVTAAGHVEDVPPESGTVEAAADAGSLDALERRADAPAAPPADAPPRRSGAPAARADGLAQARPTPGGDPEDGR